MSSNPLSRFYCNVEEEYEKEETPFDHGQYGQVYKGKRRSDGLEVAIKILDSKMLQKNDYLEWDFFANQKNLVRELNILANINHPFCLQLINFNLSPDPTIITPYMPKGNLLKLILDTNPALSTRKLCSIYAICSTMDFLHSIGIIHRDIKPQNIFINKNDDICIADFGTSRKVEENIHLTQAKIGTPAYMAPELVKYDEYSNKVDVYSFGVIYYQFFLMNTKFKLNDKKTPPQSANAFMNRVAMGARFVRPKNMNDDQWKVYTDCTNGNADERPSFNDLIQRFETDESIWIDGCDEEEFREYVKKCKEINQETKEKHKNMFLPENISLSPDDSSSTNLSRSVRLSSSYKSSPKKTRRPHITYDDK